MRKIEGRGETITKFIHLEQNFWFLEGTNKKREKLDTGGNNN